jgi:hypothetical protein
MARHGPRFTFMVGDLMSIHDMFFGKSAVVHDEKEVRPVKMVQESANVWRIVYAD